MEKKYSLHPLTGSNFSVQIAETGEGVRRKELLEQKAMLKNEIQHIDVELRKMANRHDQERIRIKHSK